MAAGLLAGAALLVPLSALAAEPIVTFSIPAEPLDDALAQFGRQAGVSIGLRDPTRCGRMAQAVVGRLTPTAALTRLLSGTHCGYAVLDARAYSVEPQADAAATPRKAPPRQAEETGAPENDLLLDVTVTTTRRPSLVGQTPASISVVAAPSLAVARIDDLEDLSAEFAGVTVTNLGPGRNKVLVRGLSDGAFTGRTQSTIGLYLNDVPITYNTPDPDLRLVDVDRVELMRGPQGPLYGTGSMGGIVRIVTKKPDLLAPAMGAAVGGEVTQSGAPGWSADAMLNVPVVNGRVAVRGVAYTETEGGYVDDVDLGIKNANTTRRTGGRAAVTVALAPDWEVTAEGTHQLLRSDDSQYTQYGPAGPTDLDGLQRQGRVREPHDSDFNQANLSLEGLTSLGRLRVTGSILDHTFDARSDASNGLALFVSNGKVGAFDQDYRIRLVMGEAVLTSTPGGRFQWLLGVFGSQTRETMFLKLSDVTTKTPVALYDEERHDRLGEVDGYGEASYAITPKLTLTAGLRGFYTWLDTDSLRHQQAIPLAFSGSLQGSKVSPKAVLSWQITPTRLVYVQVAQGFREGGFNTTGRINQQFNADATGNQPNRQYRPDTVWSYEAGAKLAFDNHRWELRAAAFYTDWRDVQSDQFLPSGLPYTANVGRAVNTGVEAEGIVRVDNALSLRLNALVAGPQLTERDPTYPARPNASLPVVPRYSASFIADWSHELKPGMKVTLYGRVAYTGSSIVTFQNQASSAMGNYVTARIAASLEVSRWRMTAFIDNPANAVGDTFAFGDPFTQGRVQQSTPLRPRTIGLTLATGL